MEYLHGGDIYRNQAEYDFSVNINPLGMPLNSIQAAHEGIVLAGRYPDYKCERLCQEIADFHSKRLGFAPGNSSLTKAASKSLDVEYILPGNGAAELIYTLCYAIKPERALSLAPTFQEYEMAVKAAGGEMEYHYLREENGYDLSEDFLDIIAEETSWLSPESAVDETVEAGSTAGHFDILFICNPNNPTGRIIKRDMLVKMAELCRERNAYLCVDESFLPFLTDEERYTMVGYLEEFDNLIVLRSFTKIYGMPGLRLGYVLSSNKQLLDNMREKCQPWSVSAPAQLAGVSAMRDVEFLHKTREIIIREREFLKRELLPVIAEKYYDSYANFILFKGEANLKDRLLSEGILIRDCSSFAGLSQGYYRIAVRSASENKEFVRRIKAWQR